MKYRIGPLIVIAVGFWIDDASCAQPKDWEFFNFQHGKLDRIVTPQAQHGQSVALLNTSHLDFRESYADDYQLPPSILAELNITQKYYDDAQPLSYLYQTFNAEKYKNKHLHISAFAKSLEPDFKALEAWYSEQYSLFIESELAIVEAEHGASKDFLDKLDSFNNDAQLRKSQALVEFSQFIRQSYQKAHFEVWVVLYRKFGTDGKSTIQAIAPTSSSRDNSREYWNRFNLEVGVPEDCFAISVVLESRGLNQIYFDHLALTVQGKRINEQQRYYQSMSPQFIEHIVRNFKVGGDSIKNTSFEH